MMENEVDKVETVSVISVEEAVVNGAIDVTKHAIQCLTEYMECKEHEKTERKRIVAELKATIHRIDAQKEVCLQLLNYEHEEKMHLYSLLEESQRKALEIGDHEMLRMCYDVLLQIYIRPAGQKIDMSNMIGKAF